MDVNLSDVLLTLMTLIMMGGIPFSFKVHGRLVAIEVGVRDTKELAVVVSSLKDEFHKIDVRIAKMENVD